MSSSSSSSSSDGSDGASSSSSSSLPPTNAASMPMHMYYTSLSWLATSSGTPLPVDQTPPTSPAKVWSNRGTPMSGTAPETPEQRRQRQAAFIAQKNKEMEEIRKKTVKDLLAEAKKDEEEAKFNPSTPQKKIQPSSEAVTPVPMTPDPSSLVSPEKRRAKKLSSLQYPIFSVYWLDPNAAQNSGASSSSSSDSSLGLILLGGGGGRKGAGIDSGMLVCSVLPANSDVFNDASSPIRMSQVTDASLALNPISFLDSNDFLIGSLLPHPNDPVIAATVGAGTALLRAMPKQNTKAGPELEVEYEHARQTDFHKESTAQAQAWSPCGRWLVTGGEDRTMRIWSYPELEYIGILQGNDLDLDSALEQHKQPILSLHVNADGTKIVSCAGDNSIKIWDSTELNDAARTGAVGTPGAEVIRCPLIHNLTLKPAKGSILKFQVARFYGGSRMTKLTASKRKSAAVLAEEDEEVLEQKEDDAPDAESTSSSSSSSSSEYLIAISSQIKRGGGSSSLVKFSCDDFSLLKEVSLGQAPLTTMEISEDVDDPFVALANTDGLVAVYRAESMKCVKKVPKVHDLPATALAFSPASLASSSRWLISASADKSVAIIAVPSEKPKSGGFLTVLFHLVLLILAIAAALLGGYIGANPQAWSRFG